MVLFVLAGLSVIGVAGILGVPASIFPRHSRYSVYLASTCFVLTAVAGGALRKKNWYGRMILVGLVFCWVGDVIDSRAFVQGLVSFWLGHFFFIAAFLTRGVRWRRLLPALGAYLTLGAAVLAWLLPHVPAPYLFPVVAYTLIICTMAAMAFSIKVTRGYLPIAAGAAIFFFSDIFVARWRFVSSDHINAFGCYPLYYTGCMLLALSVYFVSRQGLSEGYGHVATEYPPSK